MEGSVFPGSVVFKEKVPDGFTFLGWSPNPYDRTPKYKEGDTEDIYDSETVYAIWKRDKIRYETNFPENAYTSNGRTLTNVSKLLEGDKIKDYKEVFPTDTNPYPADYAFFGWSTNPKASRPDYSPGERIADSDSILYAVWQKPEITLHTNYPAINQGLSNSKKTYTPSKNIWDKHFNQSVKPAGYDLLGWSTSPDGEVEFSNEEPLDTSKLAIDADLYAIWSEPKNVWITVNNEVDDNLHKTDTVSVSLRYEVGNSGYDLPWNLEIAHGQVTPFVVPTHAENITVYVSDSKNRVISVDEVTERGQNNGYNPKALQGDFDENTHNEANPVVISIKRIETFMVNPNYPEEAKYKADGSEINERDKAQKEYERNKDILDEFQLTDKLGVWNRHFGLDKLPAGYDLKGWNTDPNSDKVEFLDISDIDIARFSDLEVIYAVFSKSKEVHIKLEDTDKALGTNQVVNVDLIYKIEVNGEDREFTEKLTYDTAKTMIAKLPTHAKDVKIVVDTPEGIITREIDGLTLTRDNIDANDNYFSSPGRLEGDFDARAVPEDNPIVIKIFKRPPPTGIIDNVSPMVTLFTIAITAFIGLVIYNKKKLGGTVDG